ncbi:peptidylprolyl isomerase [Methanimicrococcus blatticola]|uniref:Peptidyl-prolyl cis-trans isomerase n=1 Tax=Methanimicrococcus blatticola TaxID=91560 RepID=A0A484F790_9EURY|nr:peptidylprolyl isomerase [Methanimicrococcus blatticola]MBZ3935190.1 peptidylprolyl isomerase [Methanimicrococcus blatticola]MCC2508713.1 peptidylprolyl isomerase [Methanimicrococcus blatticola]TDQ71252.1 FKBP-type peptidyl-prolyl cis-trans isomerase SlyD [Methanimicrococcus blatticola]
MALKKGDFIRLNYTGRMENGTVFDTTDEEVAKAENVYTPQGLYGGDVIVIGYGHTIGGLDKELEGKEAGAEGEVTIGPEDAFGMPKEELIQSVSTSKFKDGRAQIGMIIESEGRQGVVTKVIGRRATIDFNSPLAGKSVTYSYKIEAVLETAEEKINGLFALYTGVQDADVKVNGDVADIEIPTGITFNQRWLFSKGKLANEILENTDLKEIRFIESVKKEEKAE